MSYRPPPRSRRKMYDLLHEREREDLFRNPQVDLFGAPVDPEGVAAVVELRNLAEAAVTSTTMRANVRDRLSQAVTGGAVGERNAWLRLLAAERSRLKLPPLRFYELRRLVAELALVVALSRDAVHPGLRRQAIVVLRATSKRRLIDSLSDVFKSVLGTPDLIPDVLYAVFSYLRQPYHDSESMLNELHRQLTRCRELVKDVADEGHRLEFNATLTTLLRSTEFKLTLSGVGRLDTVEAWRLLQSRYRDALESHHEASTSINKVSMAVAEPVHLGVFPDRRLWQTVLDDWQTCESFLAADVLPYVRLVGSVLLGEYYSGVIPPEYLRKLREITERDPIHSLARVTNVLYEFAKDPDTFKRDSRREYAKRELHWWFDFFLDGAMGPDGESPYGIRLLQLLRRCPSELRATVHSAFDEMAARFTFDLASLDVSDDYVFCDRELLKHAVKHLIENAVGSKHRVQGKLPRIRCFSQPNAKREIELIVLNDGTEEIPKGRGIKTIKGRGIETINMQMKAFRGHIQGSVESAPWSYRAVVSLPNW